MACRYQTFKVTMFLTSFICMLLVAHSDKPVDVARKVGNAFLVNELTFINWEGGFQYGPAIVVDGLYEALEILDESTKKSWESQLSQILNHYYNTDSKITIPCNQTCPYGKCLKFRSCAHDILKSKMSLSDSIFRNVGDLMNLFPIGYLRRYNLNNKLYANDLEVAKIAVKNYILPFPLRTFDGTFSRTGGFNFKTFTAHKNSNENYSEKNVIAPFLWADDQFMGLTLIARLSTTDASSLTTQERFELVDMLRIRILITQQRRR